MKLLFPLLLFSALISTAQNIQRSINWQKFMQTQSLRWDSISADYYTGILLGNGRLGTNIYKENDHSIRFDIGRSDVTDQRSHYADSIFTEQLVSRPRLPIGKMLLNTKGRIISVNLQLNIYDAVVNGIIKTTLGQIEIDAFVPTGEEVIAITAKGLEAEKNVEWKWVPEKSISPRVSMGRANANTFNYQPNPDVQLKDSAGYKICYQSLLLDGEYSTVWKEFKKLTESRIVISVGFSNKLKSIATNEAIDYIDNFILKSPKDIVSRHQQWWHHYFQQSFVSIPDARMQNYYWLQLYNLASATRTGKPMVDLMGPWFTSKTPWPAIWWNLNTQLAYSPVFTSNHLEMGRSLFDALYNNRNNLIKNVPAEWQYDAAAIGRISSYDLVSPLVTGDLRNGRFEPGNLTWAMFYYYQYFLYSKDTLELKERIYPLLKRSVNYMLHLLHKDDNGIYHLVKSHSPEYTDAEDAHYSLSALKWGLKTLLNTSSFLNLNDSDTVMWKDISINLAPYHVNEDGYMIGKDVALTSSHRHFSHLMMIYPYKDISTENSESVILAEKSISHWENMPNAFAGYSYVIASSMYSFLGKGNEAYDALNKFIIRHCEANALYREAGPCFETPMAMANSILEMLLQSSEAVVKIFPAIPADWRDVSFADLRAEGAFLISAVKLHGKTEGINVKSEKGGSIIIETDIPADYIHITCFQKNKIQFRVSKNKNKTHVLLSTNAGDEIYINDNRVKTPVIIGSVKATKYSGNYWGLQKSIFTNLMTERQYMFSKTK